MIRRIAFALLFVVALVGLIFYSQHRAEPNRVSGIVEADEIRVGSRLGGRVLAVHVQEGQRVTAEIIENERIEPFDSDRRRVDYVAPTEPIVRRQLPAVTVSDVDLQQQSLSFTVDEVGVPVLVKVSYFPNWQVSGAEGPYRAGANHMVVIPTQENVELTYDVRSNLDWFFYLLTAIGIGLCVLWRIRGDVEYEHEEPSWARRPPPDAGEAAVPGDPVAPDSPDSLDPEGGIGHDDVLDGPADRSPWGDPDVTDGDPLVTENTNGRDEAVTHRR